MPVPTSSPSVPSRAALGHSPEQADPGGHPCTPLTRLQGTGHSTRPLGQHLLSPAASREQPQGPQGQPGWVIQGTAALISSQNSRITACQGCLESSNMVSVPTASQGCSTTPLRGVTQHPCSSGTPREGGFGIGQSWEWPAGPGPWMPVSTLHGTLIQPGPAVRAGIQQQEPHA